MPGFIRRHNLFITSAALLVCSFQLMSLSIADRAFPRLGGRVVSATLTPVHKIIHETGQTARYLWDHYIWLLGVEAERNELLARVKALEAQNSRLIEYEHENSRLRVLLEFSEHTGLRGLPASIVARDPSNWIRSVTIDRGRAHGVEEGMSVVDGHAIVGRTTVVSDNSSTVLLLTDNLSAIDAIVQRTRASGIVEGSFEHGLRMRYVSNEYPVIVGDRVIASGLDEVFPKGTLIGVVTHAEKDDRGLFQNIEVEPSAHLERLENVLVLLPGQEPQGELLLSARDTR